MILLYLGILFVSFLSIFIGYFWAIITLSIRKDKLEQTAFCEGYTYCYGLIWSNKPEQTHLEEQYFAWKNNIPEPVMNHNEAH